MGPGLQGQPCDSPLHKGLELSRCTNSTTVCTGLSTLCLTKGMSNPRKTAKQPAGRPGGEGSLHKVKYLAYLRPWVSSLSLIPKNG